MTPELDAIYPEIAKLSSEAKLELIQRLVESLRSERATSQAKEARELLDLLQTEIASAGLSEGESLADLDQIRREKNRERYPATSLQSHI